MEKLSHLDKKMLTGIIGEKMAKLTKGELSYKEALQEVSAIEGLYEQMYGARSTWSYGLEKAVDGIRANIVEFYSRKDLGTTI